MTTIVRTAMVAAGSLILIGCGGGGGGSGSPSVNDPEPASAALSRVADCDALLTAIRADARAKIHVQADELRIRGWFWGGGGGVPVASPTPLAAATPAAGEGPSPGNATDTNTQVPGVDELDVVETDGKHLYLLRGGELLVFTTSPPEATALAERIAIEGGPRGMFVAGGRALVVSDVYDDGTLGGNGRCDAIGPPFPVPGFDDPAPGVVPPFVPSCQSLFAKLTLLDLTTAPARVAREVYVEGQVVAARRHAARARIVIQREWGAPSGVADPWGFIWSETPADEREWIARVDAWEQQALAAVDASTLADWLPVERERVAGTLVERPLTCTDARVPATGEARHGTILVTGLDMTSDDAPLTNTVLVGEASQVYASGDLLVLAYPEWQAAPLDDAATRTAVHVFALPADSFASVYLGSGFVPGTPLSQFAFDARGDVIRVATSFMSHTQQQTVTRVTTARIEDDALVTLGASADLAPGEQLLGARFLGDRAYLVTFRLTDPLFVVGLGDPTHPTLLGETELPGFSEYLHPLDPDHLLTIGRTAGGFGQPSALALRIFDVGDPTSPRLAHERVLASDVSTPAEADHLAFTFDTRLGLLALPVNSYRPTGHATLHLFGVDAVAGFDFRGVVDHGGASLPPCAPPFDWEACPTFTTMLRGLFIDDFVYSISDRQVQVHTLDALATPLATVRLP